MGRARAFDHLRRGAPVPSCKSALVALSAGSALLWVGLLGSGCGEAFSGGGTGAQTTTGSGGAGAHTSTTSGDGGGNTTSTSHSGAAGLGGSAGGTATGVGAAGGTAGAAPEGGAGGGPSCSHDVCTTGGPLRMNCGECETLVCADESHPSCCSVRWSVSCVQWADALCEAVECDSPCDASFGQLNGYVACPAPTSTSCKFITSAAGSCAELCAAQGTLCTTASVEPSSCDAIGNQTTCTYGAGNLKLCVCTAG